MKVSLCEVCGQRYRQSEGARFKANKQVVFVMGNLGE